MPKYIQRGCLWSLLNPFTRLVVKRLPWLVGLVLGDQVKDG